MKTTIELPDELFRRLKMRAAEEGRTMKDLLTELVRGSLASKSIRRKKAKPLPIIKGGRPAKRGEGMTPDRVAEILWGSGE